MFETRPHPFHRNEHCWRLCDQGQDSLEGVMIFRTGYKYPALFVSTGVKFFCCFDPNVKKMKTSSSSGEEEDELEEDAMENTSRVFKHYIRDSRIKDQVLEGFSPFQGLCLLSETNQEHSYYSDLKMPWIDQKAKDIRISKNAIGIIYNTASRREIWEIAKKLNPSFRNIFHGLLRCRSTSM